MEVLLDLRNCFFTFLFLIPSLYQGILATTAPPTLPSGYECNYEINLFDAWCGMTQETGDDFDWMRKTSDDDTFTDPEPSVDHTTHLIHGHYLYSPSGTIGLRGQLNMPTFAANMMPQCLEFFYQIGGDNSGTLNVYQWLSSSTMPSTAAWMMTGDTADVWNRGLVTIAPGDSYTLAFESVTGSNSKAFIALDDVKVSDGACPLEVLNCTFEEGLCDFVQQRNDYQDWYRQSGSTSSQNTGPTNDHTLGTSEGFYIFVEASYSSLAQTINIETPSIRGVSDGSPPTCLTFFYHMFGDDVGTLNVYVIPVSTESDPPPDDMEPAWSLTGNRGDRWRGAEVDIAEVTDDFTIVFEVVRGYSYLGDVALDDIDLQRGAECPGRHKPSPGNQQGTCDFEEIELCGYVQDQTDDADWLWQNRASPYTEAGPLYDHTTNEAFGFYLFLYGNVGHRKTARIISPDVPRQSSHTCLQFWWHLYGNDDQKLSVYCVQDGAEIPDTPLLSNSGDYGDYWRRSRHEIPPEMTPCKLIFEGTTGIHNRDDIAIDDVSVFQSEQCPQDPYFINPTTTPPTTNNVNCNFDSDNNPMCGWTQSLRDEFDWIRWRGETPDYSSGPDVDHTTQTANGYFMLINSYESTIPDNARAEMISPLIAPSSTSRCFQFWYFMNGFNTHFLNIFILPYGQTLPIDPNKQYFGNMGSNWLLGQMTVPASTRSFYIVVEGTMGLNTFNADIAVDDFTITSGTCSETSDTRYPFVANCDFETDMCGYTQPVDDYNDNDDFDWFWNSGSTGTDGTGPSTDHTLGTADGHYLYLEASQPRRPGDRAIVISPMINKFNDSYCLEFFYHMSGDDTASLAVVQRGDYYLDTEIARLTGPAGDGWKPFNADVGIKYGPVEIVFIGSVGNNYRGDIGLDDITFTPGPCEGYPRESLCNFELGYQDCGYTQSTSHQLQWMWFDALVGENPPIDWPGHGSFMYVDGTNKTEGHIAVFQSPLLSSYSNDKCLSFNYALSGGMTLMFTRVNSDHSHETMQNLTSYTKSTPMTSVNMKLSASDHPFNYKIAISARAGSGMNGLAVVDDVAIRFGQCGADGQPVSSDSTATTVAIVLGILLGLAALVLVALGVLHYRNNSKASNDFPAAVSYKNGGSVNQPDLSKDPGIANPNYTSAPFSSA